MANLLHAYAGDITVKGRTDSGDLIVQGVATNDALDLDGDRCDPQWLKSAMPKWMEWGNIREQHSSIAAGVGIELAEQGTDWHLKALITDPNTAHKFETGTLKGWSVGIKNARVRTDKSGQRWICGGDIVEISGVDRPCNPTCAAGIVKSIGGEYKPVRLDDDINKGLESDSGALTVPSGTEATQDPRKAALEAIQRVYDASKGKAVEPVNNEQPDIDGAQNAIGQICDLIISEAQELKRGRDEESCDISLLMNAVGALQNFKQREAQQGLGDSGMNDAVTTVALEADPEIEKAPEADEPKEDLFKYVNAEKRRQMARSGQAMPDGSFPIADEGHLRSAIGRLGNYKGNKAKAKKHIIRRAKALGATNLLPDNWTGGGKKSKKNQKTTIPELTKAAVSTSAAEKQDVQDIVKAAITEAIASQEETIKSLRAELAEVKSRPIPGGPVLITKGTKPEVEHISEADRYLRKASITGLDPSVAAAYRAKAAELRALETA